MAALPILVLGLALAGKPSTLTLQPARGLEPAGEQWMLVGANGRDLRVGTRVKPERTADGNVTVTFAAPASGRYTLYTAFREADGVERLVPVPVMVR